MSLPDPDGAPEVDAASGALRGGAGPGAAAGWIQKAPVVVVVGHYGVGKTNLSLNLAVDAAERGGVVTLVDLDVVNPFFRSSDSRELLAERGVGLIAPVFAGTNLDGPSLSGAIGPAVQAAQRAWRGEGARKLLLIDAGGDDVGATALGCFASAIRFAPYEMLYVVNRSRNLAGTPGEAIALLREIEQKSRLKATCIVNNTHLQAQTDLQTIEGGMGFAKGVAEGCGLPLAFTTAPRALAKRLENRQASLRAPIDERRRFYPVHVYVKTPWD